MPRGDQGQETETRLREANALLARSAALLKAGRDEETIACCDEVAARFGDAPELDLRVIVVQALDNKIDAMNGVGNREGARAAWGEVLARYGNDAQPASA